MGPYGPLVFVFRGNRDLDVQRRLAVREPLTEQSRRLPVIRFSSSSSSSSSSSGYEKRQILSRKFQKSK